MVSHERAIALASAAAANVSVDSIAAYFRECGHWVDCNGELMEALCSMAVLARSLEAVPKKELVAAAKQTDLQMGRQCRNVPSLGKLVVGAARLQANLDQDYDDWMGYV